MNSLQLLVLVVTLSLVIFGIYWGVKRMRRRKYEGIKTRLRYQTSGGEETGQEFSSELPGGGARVIGHRDPEDIHTVNKRIREQAEANKPKLSINIGSPKEQGALDLGLDEDKHSDPHIPVLLDPTEEIGEPQQAEQAVSEPQSVAEELSANLDSVIAEPEIEQPALQNEAVAPEEDVVVPEAQLAAQAEEQAAVPQEIVADEPEQEKPDHSILFSDPETTERNPARQEHLAAAELTDTAPSTEQVKTAPQGESQSDVAQQQEQNAELTSATEAETVPEPEPDEVIIINLMCMEDGDEFVGTELCAALEGQSMKHGYMDIFHFDSGSGADTLRFSAANILNPGTFPTEKLEYFYTPGICFFMTMTAGVSNLQTFNQLLSAARGVASKLGGELKDQDRDYLTHQRVEEIRTRMGEFQREKLLR